MFIPNPDQVIQGQHKCSNPSQRRVWLTKAQTLQDGGTWRSYSLNLLWRRKWQSTPVFLPGESHGWRSLVGYGPRGHKESDTTERLHLHLLPHAWDSGICHSRLCRMLSISFCPPVWLVPVHPKSPLRGNLVTPLHDWVGSSNKPSLPVTFLHSAYRDYDCRVIC